MPVKKTTKTNLETPKVSKKRVVSEDKSKESIKKDIKKEVKRTVKKEEKKDTKNRQYLNK